MTFKFQFSLAMVLTLYKLDVSPAVRSVYMVIEALNIPDVEYVNVDLLSGEHLKEDYLKVSFKVNSTISI